jgi:signal transduction histidine kinase
MMERMVEQRVEELNSAYRTLEKLDKNKSDFIQVAAHELRTPLTVIKGYMGMIKSAPAIEKDASLVQAMEGVIQGTDRLHQVVNSMLDVARLENEVITPHRFAPAATAKGIYGGPARASYDAGARTGYQLCPAPPGRFRTFEESAQ